MRVKINGNEQFMENRVSILELIREKGLKPDNIVIEHNYNIIPKERWPEIVLQDADSIEIVSFVGGG